MTSSSCIYMYGKYCLKTKDDKVSKKRPQSKSKQKCILYEKLYPCFCWTWTAFSILNISLLTFSFPVCTNPVCVQIQCVQIQCVQIKHIVIFCDVTTIPKSKPNVFHVKLHVNQILFCTIMHFYFSWKYTAAISQLWCFYRTQVSLGSGLWVPAQCSSLFQNITFENKLVFYKEPPR